MKSPTATIFLFLTCASIQVFAQEPPVQGKHFASETSCAYIHHLALPWHLVKYFATVCFNTAFANAILAFVATHPLH